jgi:hypothetical protein
LGSKILYLSEYSRSFYTKPDSNTALTNTFTLHGNYELGKYNASLTYSHLFGNGSSSNLFVPSISRMFRTKKLGFIDKITFSPTISATIGNSSSFSNTFNPATNGNPFFNGTTIDTTGRTIGGRPTWGNGTGTRPSSLGSGPPSWVTNGQNPSIPQDKFGVMAYTFSVPISVKIKDFRFSFTPNLIKLVKVNTYEQLNPRPQFNFTMGLTYSFGW